MGTVEKTVSTSVPLAQIIEKLKEDAIATDPSIVSDEPPIADLTKELEQISLVGPKPYKLVNSSNEITEFLDSIANLPTDPPSLYIDIEGVRLGRDGSISIVQILTLPQNDVYLIDVHTLGSSAFSTSGSNGATLQTVLECASIPKVFFDVRNDSDALFSNHGIRLAGIHDLQVMEFATRRVRARFLSGLAKCIEKDLVAMSRAEARAWKATKEKGLDLFAPERGGSYEVFNVRPLSEEIASYCAQDVQYMPRLWTTYKAKLSKALERKASAATEERVRLSQGMNYNGRGRHMAIGPW